MIANFTSSPHCIDQSGKPHGSHCRTCRSDQKWRESVGAPAVCPHGVTIHNLPLNQSSACIHRGAEVRRAECTSCRGKVMAKILSCAVHGECSQFSKPLGVQQCSTCPDKKHP